VYESHVSLSRDGNTLTEEMTYKTKDGKEGKQKQVWNRVGAASGKPSSKRRAPLEDAPNLSPTSLRMRSA
jgi:hypothetical protein